MKILFFTHYFPPEGNAPASRTYEHCVRWVKAGHDVTVITCVPNVPSGVPYDGYANRWRSQKETIDGINVVRVWTLLAANAGFFKRILNYLSYMMMATWTGLWQRGQVTTTDGTNWTDESQDGTGALSSVETSTDRTNETDEMQDDSMLRWVKLG